VHKARVASRRVREALPVVLAQAPARRSARLRRSFRRVTRALGPLRELDVTRRVLDEWMLEDPAIAPVVSGLARRLDEQRPERRDEMLARLDEVDFESLVTRIERLMDERADESDEARALPDAIEGTLGIRVARRGRALDLAVGRAGGLYAVDALHRVRIAIKKLRYALELAVDMRMLRSRRPLGLLRSVQEVLGRLHDEQVVVDRIRRYARDEDAEPPALAAALDRIEARCRERHASYLALRPRLLAAAAQAVATVTVPRPRVGRATQPAATVH
jgi:CHAD domain-containing protein